MSDAVDWSALLEVAEVAEVPVPEHVVRSLVGKLRDDPEVRRSREDRLEEQRKRREEWHA